LKSRWVQLAGSVVAMLMIAMKARMLALAHIAQFGVRSRAMPTQRIIAMHGSIGIM
jgi:hypothetical protein